MMMDLLYWKRRFSQTEVLPVTKKFYRSFLYKMTVYAPGCRSIHHKDIKEHLDFRRHGSLVSYNYAGSWYNDKMRLMLEQADVDHLKTLQQILYQHNDVKLRVEEPYVDIYTHSEQKLREVSDMLSNPGWVKSVSGPINKQAETLLVDNKILRKRKPKWRYKINLKDKKFSSSTRTSIRQYLIGLGDEIKIPGSTLHQLTKPHEWIWGCYFYTNDPGIVTMVQLIDPDIVREVCEMVQIGGK